MRKSLSCWTGQCHALCTAAIMRQKASSLLFGLPPTYKSEEIKGLLFLRISHARQLTHRKGHQISFLLLAMPYINSAQSTSPPPSSLLLGPWWLICTLMEVSGAYFILWKELWDHQVKDAREVQRGESCNSYLCAFVRLGFFSFYKNKICTSS